MELSVCPFCGKGPIVRPYSTAHGRVMGYIIECQPCGVQLFKNNKRNLLQAWNSRKEANNRLPETH